MGPRRTRHNSEMMKYPLVSQQFANLKMAIEIVSFPINSMVIFHSCFSLPEGNKNIRESVENIRFSVFHEMGIWGP